MSRQERIEQADVHQRLAAFIVAHMMLSNAAIASLIPVDYTAEKYTCIVDDIADAIEAAVPFLDIEALQAFQDLLATPVKGVNE